jgi:hypothetical protein
LYHDCCITAAGESLRGYIRRRRTLLWWLG